MMPFRTYKKMQKDLAHHAKHKAEQVSSEVAGKVGEKVEEVKGKIHEAANK